MRRFIVSVLAGLVFLNFNVVPVYGQATILPEAEKDVDCLAILAEFEISGKIPTAEEQKANDELAQQKDDIAKDVTLKEDDAKKAQEEKDAADKAAAESQKKLDDAQKELGDLQKKCNDTTLDVAEQIAACQDLDGAKSKVDAVNQENLQATMKQSVAKDTLDSATKAKEEATKKSKEAEKASKTVGMRDNLLGCAIQKGRVSLQMIPYFLTYMINWMLGLIGIVSVLFIIIGGYFYIYGGLTDNKERGKKYVTNALIGMSLAFLAWVIVQAIITAITS